MTNKRKLNIFIFVYLIFFISLILLLVKFDKIPCLFKNIFNIPCPFCGMTRAFKEILKLNFSKAFYYNIMSIPLFILIICFLILFIKDIITKNTKSLDFINKIFLKYWYLIILIIIISEIVNIIHGI